MYSNSTLCLVYPGSGTASSIISEIKVIQCFPVGMDESKGFRQDWAPDRTGLQVTSHVTLNSLTSLNLLTCFYMVVRRFKQDVVYESTLGL